MGSLEGFAAGLKGTPCPKNVYIYISQSEPTIPRIELCAAVLAVEIISTAYLVRNELYKEFDAVHSHTDSKVVLGYICKKSKRFYTYVHNRVQRIRQPSKPKQWHYVRTEETPADQASRSLTASPTWFIHRLLPEDTNENDKFELVESDKDCEIRPQMKTCATHLQVVSCKRFERFSTVKSGPCSRLSHSYGKIFQRLQFKPWMQRVPHMSDSSYTR